MKDTKMIRVTSRGFVMTNRGRVMSPIMSPYRETISRIWTMITADRADVEEKLPDGSFIKLNAQNFDKDNFVSKETKKEFVAPELVPGNPVSTFKNTDNQEPKKEEEPHNPEGTPVGEQKVEIPAPEDESNGQEIKPDESIQGDSQTPVDPEKEDNSEEGSDEQGGNENPDSENPSEGTPAEPSETEGEGIVDNQEPKKEEEPHNPEGTPVGEQKVEIPAPAGNNNEGTVMVNGQKRVDPRVNKKNKNKNNHNNQGGNNNGQSIAVQAEAVE